MNDENSLADIFSQFDARKSEEKRNADEKAAREEVVKQEAIKVLKDNVVPVLERMASEISAHGHELTFKMSSRGQAGISIEFRPVSKDNYGGLSRAEIRHYGGTWFDNKFDYRSGYSTKYASTKAEYFRPKFSDVTESWARNFVLDFIKTALSLV